MPTFKTFDALQKYILTRSVKAVRDVQEVAYNTIKAFLDSYYAEYDPVEYIRTQQLLNSLVKTDVSVSGSSCVAEVYFDASALSYQNPVQGKSGNWHFANWTGQMVLDDAVGSGGHGGYTYGTAVWPESMSVLNRSRMIQELKTALINAGVPVK